jgi:hypothetical protein
LHGSPLVGLPASLPHRLCLCDSGWRARCHLELLVRLQTRHLRGLHQWIPSPSIKDSRMVTEIKVRNCLTHSCSTHRCRANYGVDSDSCLASKLCACLEFYARQAAGSWKNLWAKFAAVWCLLLAADCTSAIVSARPEASYHYTTIAVDINNISPHINYGRAPDLTTRLRRHTWGSWGRNPLCGAIWRALPHGSLLGILFPRIDPCWSTTPDHPLARRRELCRRKRHGPFS